MMVRTGIIVLLSIVSMAVAAPGYAGAGSSRQPIDSRPSETFARLPNFDETPGFGPADARVILVVFSDYACHPCAQASRVLSELADMYPNEMRIAVKHYPMSMQPASIMASVGALAAYRQGRFREFHSALFENADDLTHSFILDVADDIELDMAAFRRDLRSPELLSVINRNLAEGEQLGITETPTIFVNGKLLEPFDMDHLTEMIEAEMK